jgi:hypothetical protein
MKHSLITPMDIVQHYGSDLGVEGLKTRYQRFIKYDVLLLQEAVRSGVDPKLVKLSCDSNDKKGQICILRF